MTLKNMKNSRENKGCRMGDTGYRIQDVRCRIIQSRIIYLAFCVQIIFVLLMATQCFAEDGKPYLENGLKAYNSDADFDKAISELKKAVQLGLKEKSDNIQAHLYLGFAYIAKNQRINAVVEFAKTINLDPELSLDPKVYSSKIISVFNETKQSLVDSLTVVSTPGGADVLLDGKKFGVTPIKINGVLVGEHSLTVVKEYYQPKNQTIQVYKAEENRIEVLLDKAEVEVQIKSVPPDSMVYIANNPIGKTPLSVKISLDKEISVKLAKEEFLDKEINIKLLPNGINIGTDKFFPVKDNIGEVVVELSHAPVPGSLKITTIPADAVIYLDGVEIGKTPFVMSKVTPGSREIRVNIPNFDSMTKRISIVSNKETAVEFILGGVISFTSVPNNAQIYLDDKPLGRTTFKSDRLPVGSHQIRFTKDRYKDKSMTVILERGQEMGLGVRLNAQKGSLSVSSDPPDTEVYLDGELKGKTPLLLYSILVGKYSIKLVKSGYDDYNSAINVEENDLSWHFGRLVKK
jgi:hypothetical protein